MVLLQCQAGQPGSRCSEDSGIFPTPPTDPSARTRDHLPDAPPKNPTRREEPPRSRAGGSAGPDAGHIPGGLPGEKWRKTPFELSSPSHRSGELPSLRAADAGEHLFGPAATRGPRHPLGSGSTRAWLAPGNVRIGAGPFWQPGGHPKTHDQVASPLAAPSSAKRSPPDRAGHPADLPHGVEGRRTDLRPLQGSADPPRVTEPSPVARPEQGAPFSGLAGSETPQRRALQWTRPRETRQQTDRMRRHPPLDVPALGLAHTALEAARVGRPAPASSCLSPRKGCPDMVPRAQRGNQASCVVLRPPSRWARSAASWVLRDGDSPVKRAPSHGVLPSSPRSVKLPSRPGAAGLPDSLLRAASRGRASEIRF